MIKCGSWPVGVCSWWLRTDVVAAIENGTMDGKKHPGLGNKSGHIGFLGHGTKVAFKNIEIKELQRGDHVQTNFWDWQEEK